MRKNVFQIFTFARKIITRYSSVKPNICLDTQNGGVAAVNHGEAVNDGEALAV